MAAPPRSEHDAAESAKRAGMAKYGDSLLLYCSSRVVKTKNIIVDRLSVFWQQPQQQQQQAKVL
jgi:hypothetical protein